jgi:DNA-binding CsgD family transcriptional regulator
MFLQQHAAETDRSELRLVRAHSLTRRELEIARLASDGLSGREIALRLSRSPRTIENHIRSIYRKLGVRNRVEMVRTIDELGLLPRAEPGSGTSGRLKLQGKTFEHVINISNTLAATSHDDYFGDLVATIGQELDVPWVGISEAVPKDNVLHIIAFASAGEFGGQLECEFEGSPCSDAVRDGSCIVLEGLRERYPRDTILQGMTVQSYVGVRLEDRLLGPLGALWLMDEKPITDASDAEQSLAILAPRTAAELALAQTLDGRFE